MSIENDQAILKYFIDLKSETSVQNTIDAIRMQISGGVFSS